MNNIILVPTDFSEVCNNAMAQAVEAAKFLKYKVALLHVIDKNTKAQLKKDNEGVSYIENKLLSIANDIKESHNIEVETFAKEGDIFSTISEVAKDIGAINTIVNNLIITTNLNNWYLKAGDVNYRNGEGDLIEMSIPLINSMKIRKGESYGDFESGAVTFIEGDKRGEAPITIIYGQKRSWSGTIDPINGFGEGIKISFSPSV